MKYPHVDPASAGPKISRRARRLFGAALILATTAALSPLPLSAQDTPAPGQTATGVVRGRVFNAANGRNVNNAMVTVEGTNLQATTNEFGEYTLRGVPAGEGQLRVTYTGQEPAVLPINVAANAEIEQNVTFNLDRAETREDGTVVLNEFVVASERFRTAREIATHEERFAVTIKNVVSADAFGDIPSGNVGEFVKFLPGVQLDYGSFNGNNQGYSDNDAYGISVRGFGPEDTEIMVDGMPVASATPGNLSRLTALDQLTLNNADRVELIKVATPDMPSNSIGGQVNLITKSAFDYAKPIYTGRVYLNLNSNNTSFSKTPGPVNKETRKVTPGMELSVTQPVTKNFGISLTGSAFRESNQSYRATPQWNNNHAANYQNGAFTNAAGERTSTSNPVFTRYQTADNAASVDRTSANLRLDWRPTPEQVLRTNFQYGTYTSVEAQRKLDFRPLIAAGVDWSPTYTNGAAGNGTTAMTVDTRDREGNTSSAQAQYTFNWGGWSIAAAGSISVSESEFKDRENGHFSGLNLNLNPGRVLVDGLSEGIPTSVTTYRRANAGGALVDYTTLGNWVFDGTTAKSGEAYNKVTNGLFKIDVERDLSFIPILGSNRLSLKVGARRDEEKNDKTGLGTGYREILQPGKSYVVADILDDSYLGQTPGFGLAAQQWGSTYKLFELDQEMDLFYVPDFDESTNTRVENYNSYVNQQKSITETRDGFYGQLSGSFFRNRLSFVGGARQENAKRTGRGPYTDSKWNYVKTSGEQIWTSTLYPNGVQTSTANSPLFATNAAGTALRAQLTSEGITFPTTPYVANTLAARQLQLLPNREVNQKVSGDPSYTAAASFRLTKKLDLKASWSRSFGLPDLENLNSGILSGSNSFTVNDYTGTEEASNSGFDGQFALANAALRPETSSNIDFEVAYYTDSGGKFSIGYWHKTVTDQVVNFTSVYGDPAFAAVLESVFYNPEEYQNWRLVTSSNSSTDQKTDGWEFQATQDFRFLGEVGKQFSAFVTFAFNDLGDPQTPEPYSYEAPNGSTIVITPTVATIAQRANRFGGAGLQFASNRFSAQIRGVYRNDNEIARTALVNGPNGEPNFLRRFQPAETRIDVNFTYVLTKRYSMFVSARDVFNGERDEEIRDDLGLLPDYAQLYDRKQFGVDWTIGVTGRF